MEWPARFAYLAARQDNKRIEMYCWDLVWKLVTAHFDGDIPMPSEINGIKKQKDTRTAKQIFEDVINGLGGE